MYNDHYAESKSNPTLQNAILWGNSAPRGPQIYNGSFGGPNIADSVLQGGCPAGSGHCVHILTANPLLGALGHHGGFTQTIPLRVGSSAIDTGNNMNCPSTDQRGLARPKDGDGDGTALCDISAYEMNSTGALAFSVSPSSWNYGLIKPGTTSVPRTFTVKNAGSADLVISGAITLAGANPSQFHILSGGTCSNATLHPSDTCVVTVAFKPTIAGNRSASLRVPDNALGHPHTIALSGAAGIEQAVNGGFNNYLGASKIPAGWTAAQFNANDGKDTVNKLEGAASLKITGLNPRRTKTLMQTLAISGAPGNVFELSLWRRAQGFPDWNAAVQAQVLFYNGSVLKQTVSMAIPNGVYNFTQQKTMFTATSAYTKIVIKLSFSKSSGTLWFDGLSLLRSP